MTMYLTPPSVHPGRCINCGPKEPFTDVRELHITSFVLELCLPCREGLQRLIVSHDGKAPVTSAATAVSSTPRPIAGLITDDNDNCDGCPLSFVPAWAADETPLRPQCTHPSVTREDEHGAHGRRIPVATFSTSCPDWCPLTAAPVLVRRKSSGATNPDAANEADTFTLTADQLRDTLQQAARTAVEAYRAYRSAREAAREAAPETITTPGAVAVAEGPTEQLGWRPLHAGDHLPDGWCLGYLIAPFQGSRVHGIRVVRGRPLIVSSVFIFDAPLITHWRPFPAAPEGADA